MDEPLLADHVRQAIGYLVAIDEYIEGGLSKKPKHFAKKKLLAPMQPRSKPLKATEFLDTLAECEWALFFGDVGYQVEEEAPLPGGGNADLLLTKGAESLWIDCLSPAPRSTSGTLEDYLADRAAAKWRDQFGRDPRAEVLPAGIAIMLMKADDLMPQVYFRQLTNSFGPPPPRLWANCRPLRRVVVGCPPFVDSSPRPVVLCDWRRP